MTWNELTVLYNNRIAHLVPPAKEPLGRGIKRLEKTLREKFPEAINNPYLLIDTEYSKLREIIYYTNFRGTQYNALRILRPLLEKARIKTQVTQSTLPGDATFNRYELEQCIEAWLSENGWSNITPTPVLTSMIDVTAEKNSVRFFGASVKSVKDKKQKWKRGNMTTYEENFLNYNTFKQRLGSVFLALVEKMHENKNTFTAVFIAGDAPTIDFAAKYVKHLNKAGINVYKVKSIKDITEM